MTRGRLVLLLLALPCLALAGLALQSYPFARIELGFGLLAYAALWRWPWLWLMVVSATLPLLDLAPWTGRFFFDEFDLLMLVTAGVLFLRGWQRGLLSLPRLAGLLIGLFLISALASTLIGLLPLLPLDANAFASYWSPYNSLRVAKGLLWGVVFWWLWRRQGGGAEGYVWLALGMAVGTLGVSATALWEAWQFTGFSLATDYRVTGPFSSMHTGGAHIEAYLVVALPLLAWLLFTERPLWQRGLLGAVFLLGVTTLIVTVSRGGVIALLLALAVLAAGGLRIAIRAGRLRLGTGMIVAAVILTSGAVLAWGLQGAFFQERIARTEADRQTRVSHWSDALAMRDEGWVTSLFGMGAGSFPRAYLLQHMADRPGSYRYEVEGANTYLSLNSGGTLYMAQSVAVTGKRDYTLAFDTRSDGRSNRLEASVCEKKLFNSHRCQWLNVNFPAGGGWQRHVLRFNSGEVGDDPGWRRRPIQLSLYNPAAGTIVRTDNVSLLDDRGRNLIANGDFSAGGDHWFFKAGDHLPWHIKNLWVHLLFEHGWVGMLLFNLLLATALWHMVHRAWQGETTSLVMLAALVGLLTVGVVDSLLDAPRLAQLLVFLILAGLSRPLGSGKRRRRKRAHAAA